MSDCPSSPLTALPPSSDDAQLGGGQTEDNESLEETFGYAGPLPSFPSPTYGTFPASDDTSFRGSSPITGSKEQKREKRRQKKARRQADHSGNEGRRRRVVFDGVLQELKNAGLSFGDLMEYVFDPLMGQGNVRWHDFFIQTGRASQILDWWTSSRNSQSARNEVSSWAYQHTARAVNHEAREVTRSKRLQTMGKEFDADFVMSFSYDECRGWLEQELAPVAMSMLRAFSTPNHGRKPDREKRANMVIASSALACLGEYSHANNYSKHILGLYLYASGAQRQAISILCTLGQSVSWSSIVSSYVRRDKVTGAPLGESIGTLRRLSNAMRAATRTEALTNLNMDLFDNINMNEASPEQILGRHDTQENGTCATLVALHEANLDDMKLSDFQDRFLAARPLTFDDVLLSDNQAKQLKDNLIFTIARIIVNHGGEAFKVFEKELAKAQPASEDTIAVHQTKLYPLPAMKIDESTIEGNVKVDEAILRELAVPMETLGNRRRGFVRMKAGDQLSLSRLRAIEMIRAGQEDGYGGFFWGVWAPGLFHVKIADTTGTFINHWGKPDTGDANPGSLWFHNTVLDRLPIVLTSMPAFRVSRDLIFVSLYARVLECLLRVSGSGSLEEYAKTATWDTLLTDATKIYEQFADASIASELRSAREKEMRDNATDKDSASGSSDSDEKLTQGDMLFENAIYFLRDALLSREFSNAIKAGDSGRVVLVLKTWALSFRGNGRTKYAYEMLHLIHHLEVVWSPAICRILLQNWILNPTGNPNSFVEADLTQEHFNYWIKVFYKAHGSAATWEWLEMIAPTIDVLRRLSRMFHDVLGVDQGTKHAPADIAKDIQALMTSLRSHGVYELTPGRVFDDPKAQCAADVVEVGMHALIQGAKTPLDDYNAYFKRLQARRRAKPVQGGHTDDSNSPPTMSSPPPDVKVESDSDESAMHDEHSAQSSQSTDSIDEPDFDDLFISTNPMFAVDVGEGDGDEAALPRCSARDVALDMDVEEVEEDAEEDESDGEVAEEDEDTESEDEEEEMVDVEYREL